MKIGLGTVQFGIDYGVSNKIGKTPLDEVRCILKLAAERGITVLDTAYAYGDSEAVLGSVLADIDYNFNIVTKTPRFDVASFDPSILFNAFHQSLIRLRQPKVYGLLFHHADDLLSPAGRQLYQTAIGFKEKGMVEKIGVSVYTADQIDKIISRYTIDIIQLPINIFDQRLLASGHLKRLKQAGVEIHARSVFLQGLLLMDTNELPPFFSGLRQHHARYRAFLARQKLAPLAAALGFVQGISEIDAVICGVNDCRQLAEILEFADLKLPTTMFVHFALDDEEMINPAKWRL